MTIGSQARTAFPHQRAGHCGSGALRDLLEFHGLDYGRRPLSEGAVFGLAGGLGFLFVELPEMVPPVYLVGRTARLERDVAPHLGLGLDLRRTDDPDEGWGWLRDEIDAGRPTMVWADIAELEYLRVRMSNTRHDIVVVDYDEDEQVALVADNDRDEIQRCSLASLARARGSSGFPGPNRHATFVYEWPERLRAPEEAVADGLDRAIANMRDGGDALAAGRGRRAGRRRPPRGVVRRLARALRRQARRRAQRPARVHRQGRDGGAMFRSLHAEFLHDMGALLGRRPRCGRPRRCYDELTAAWVELARHAERREHAAGGHAVTRIAELERAGVAAMEDVRQSL